LGLQGNEWLKTEPQNLLTCTVWAALQHRQMLKVFVTDVILKNEGKDWKRGRLLQTGVGGNAVTIVGPESILLLSPSVSFLPLTCQGHSTRSQPGALSCGTCGNPKNNLRYAVPKTNWNYWTTFTRSRRRSGYLGIATTCSPLFYGAITMIINKHTHSAAPRHMPVSRDTEQTRTCEMRELKNEITEFLLSRYQVRRSNFLVYVMARKTPTDKFCEQHFRLSYSGTLHRKCIYSTASGNIFITG